MPVTKCASNGKYRIGNGSCIYDTEKKATEVWQAILASGKYDSDLNKVSYDYDDTLETDRGKELAKADISAGKVVYIITRRRRSQEVLDVAKELGIPESRVIFTNGAMKWGAIKHLGIGSHHDNNSRELNLIKRNTEAKALKFAESYSDYPESAVNAAKRALAWADKNGWGDCLTPVGKIRANQLANKEPISEDTIARMSAFARHLQYKDVPYSEGCGGLAVDAWGGQAGIEWAQNKLKAIRGE